MKMHLKSLVCLAILSTPAFAAQQADPLQSWNEGETKASIIEFVEAVTTKGSADFVPVEEHIADELEISTKSINLFFKEYLFLAPKRFYLLVNLFTFRKVLIQGECSSVMEAIVLSGIDGWSRYSERYHKLLGERPYDTLMRHR